MRNRDLWLPLNVSKGLAELELWPVIRHPQPISILHPLATVIGSVMGTWSSRVQSGLALGLLMELPGRKLCTHSSFSGSFNWQNERQELLGGHLAPLGIGMRGYPLKMKLIQRKPKLTHGRNPWILDLHRLEDNSWYFQLYHSPCLTW